MDISTTEHAHEFWATREQGNAAWVEGYWNQRTHPVRDLIAAAVRSTGAKEVIEVGAHCGVNLWALANDHAYERVCGVDISDHVIATGRKLLLESGLARTPELLKSEAGSLPFPDRSFDTVLTSNLLVCIGPDDIAQSLREIYRVAKRHIVFAEPAPPSEPFDGMSDAENIAGAIDQYPNTAYWIRDYHRALASLGCPSRIVSIRRIDPKDHIGHLNSITVLEKPTSRVG